MRARVLLRGLVAIGTALAATVVVAPVAAHAGDMCPSTDPLTVSASGTVSAGASDWYAFSTPEPASLTMIASSGDPDLKVVDAGCGTTVCYPYAGGTEHCYLPAGDYQVGVLFYSGPGGIAGYTVSVDGTTECNDGIDNDGDGRVDYPSDPGCGSAGDASEGVHCSLVSGVTICAGVNANDVVFEQDVWLVDAVPGPPYTVVGEVNVYRFTLATGDSVNLPCVVLALDDATTNACSQAGGVYVSTVQHVVRSVETVQPGLTDPIATVQVCQGELVATADDVGIASLAVLALCASDGAIGGGGTTR